jgi:threonylcarbamoyladenosine tRNA methylthiotransferase MtaB
MYSVAIDTLGCKLNQLESEAIAVSFREKGFSPVSQGILIEGPGLIIINTCTVTSKADQKSRRLIRKALRENPDSCVIVTGCYARLDPDKIELLEAESAADFHGISRLFVLEKSVVLDLPEYLADSLRSGNTLPEILESWVETAGRTGVVGLQKRSFDFKPQEFVFHSRGYLKIQDGCDNNCAYCRVRLARGPSVSLAPEAALEQLLSFELRGCAELMITGVNITQYLHSGFNLARLVEYLLAGSTTIALRLSSLEPEFIDEQLVSALAHPRIRPHFHLSVQSGSDTVLKRMGRVYDSQTVGQGIALLRSVKDNPFLACDIIAGFPGETETEFDQTLAFCAKTNFAWIHAFPYSQRPGTPAFSFGNPVCEREVTQRVEALTNLAMQGRRNYVQSWLGRELSAIVEKGGCSAGQCRAVSENYLKLIVNCPDKVPPPGSVIRCIPVVLCDGASGEVADVECSAS